MRGKDSESGQRVQSKQKISLDRAFVGFVDESNAENKNVLTVVGKQENTTRER